MSDADKFDSSIRRNLMAGLGLIAILVGGIGGWMGTAELDGAVISSGKLVVESSVKKVQHPTGGVVGELLVSEGDRVEAGEVLLRLDATQARANLAIIVHAIDELIAKKARLDAEKDGLSAPRFPDALLRRQDDPQVGIVVEGERRLFELRRSSREGERSQLQERLHQLADEIDGLRQQADAKSQEISLISTELEGVRKLWAKQLIQINRLTNLEREAARLKGERGQIIAAIAQAKGRIAEVELQIIHIDQNLRSEVGAQLAEIRGKVSELNERKVAAEDQLRRTEICAPQNGTVHQLTAHTVGGVIAGGEPIMLIVPHDDRLVVEARVAPADIDQVHTNQPATLRLSAFRMRATPEVSGIVNTVSADLSEDERTGQRYYVARISIAGEEIERLEGVTLVPGMPVEAFITTGERTALSYFLKPIRDFAARALRES
jgi:membrane fusion protein, type I secretion system